MITSRSVTRRVFLRALLWLAAFSLPRSARAMAQSKAPGDAKLLAARLVDCFVHKESARIVGLEYLRSAPKEADVTMLIDLICSGGAQRRAEWAEAESRELRETLQLQQREDFAQGRIVKVQGWMLSETEARLCALRALV